MTNETDGGEGNLNYKKSKETIKKLKKSLRKNALKIYQYSLDGIFIREWNNATEAAEAIGIKYSGILRVLKNERKKYKNYIWSYEKNDKILRYERLAIRNNASHTKHSSLSKLIKLEDNYLNAKDVFIYSSSDMKKENLIYRTPCLSIAANFLKEKFNIDRSIASIKSTIHEKISNKRPFNNLFFSNFCPYENYESTGKILKLLAKDENGKILFECCGLDDFCKENNLVKHNVINNIKGVTKYLLLNGVKIKIEYEILPFKGGIS